MASGHGRGTTRAPTATNDRLGRTNGDALAGNVSETNNGGASVLLRAPPSSSVVDDDPDRALWQSFQTAAGHVTNLYRESQKQQRRMYASGAADALDDVLMWAKQQMGGGVGSVLPVGHVHATQSSPRRSVPAHVTSGGHHLPRPHNYHSGTGDGHSWGVRGAFGGSDGAGDGNSEFSPASPQLHAAGSTHNNSCNNNSGSISGNSGNNCHGGVLRGVPGTEYVRIDAVVQFVQSLVERYAAPDAPCKRDSDAIVAGAVGNLSLGNTRSSGAHGTAPLAAPPAAAAAGSIAGDQSTAPHLHASLLHHINGNGNNNASSFSDGINLCDSTVRMPAPALTLSTMQQTGPGRRPLAGHMDHVGCGGAVDVDGNEHASLCHNRKRPREHTGPCDGRECQCECDVGAVFGGACDCLMSKRWRHFE